MLNKFKTETSKGRLVAIALLERHMSFYLLSSYNKTDHGGLITARTPGQCTSYLLTPWNSLFLFQRR